MGIEEIIIEMARQEGEDKGKAETSLEKDSFFVENLLRSTDFENKKIASLAGVSVSFVEEIRKKLIL